MRWLIHKALCKMGRCISPSHQMVLAFKQMPEFPPRADFRPRWGACPGCDVPENKWCEDDCTLLDPCDYR